MSGSLVSDLQTFVRDTLLAMEMKHDDYYYKDDAGHWRSKEDEDEVRGGGGGGDSETIRYVRDNGRPSQVVATLLPRCSKERCLVQYRTVLDHFQRSPISWRQCPSLGEEGDHV